MGLLKSTPWRAPSSYLVTWGHHETEVCLKVKLLVRFVKCAAPGL